VDHSGEEAPIGHPVDKALAPFSQSTEPSGLTTALTVFPRVPYIAHWSGQGRFNDPRKAAE